MMGVSKQRMLEVEYYLSKENLEKYLKIYSANYIATKLFLPDFKSTAGTVIDRAKLFGITTHNASSARKLNNTQTIYKETCLEKYGKDNVSKVEKIKKKKEKSAIKKYGVKNVFQSEIIKEKSKQTCLEKYGVENIGTINFAHQNGVRSKFHQQIESILHGLQIKFKSEVSNLFKKYNKFLQKEYSPIVDILLIDYRVVIECNGNFWHANPKMYNENDVFHCWDGIKTAKNIWDKDKSRKKQIESFGYTVLIIWESELSNLSKIERRIKRVISKRQNQTNKKTNKRTD